MSKEVKYAVMKLLDSKAWYWDGSDWNSVEKAKTWRSALSANITASQKGGVVMRIIRDSKGNIDTEIVKG